MTHARRRAAGAALLFLACFGFDLWALRRAPLARAEEHFQLGERLRHDREFTITDEPSVFRAPGFPAFVAAVLHVRDALGVRARAVDAVAFGHALLLAFSAAVVFFHASREGAWLAAFAGGALAAVNPVALGAARVLDYATLHSACIVIGTVLLCRAIGDSRGGAAGPLAAGAWWGLAALVRPTSLVLPPFVLLAAWWAGGRGSGRRAARFTLLFSLAMAAVVAPWTLRNHRVTGRFVPVNAQDGFALWGAAAHARPGGGAAKWTAIWDSMGAGIFARVTGSPYSLRALYDHTVPANDAFRAQAVRDIRRAPGRYARNVLANVYAFNADATATDHDMRAPVARAAAAGLLLLGLAGLARGLRRRRADACVIACVYLMFVSAHAIVFLSSKYTYVRFPLAAAAAPMAFPGGAITAATALLSAAASAGAYPSWVGPSQRAALNRADFAVIALTSREGPGYAPPPCAGVFTDVPCSDPRAPWINELARRRITGGCGTSYYCAEDGVERAQAALLLLRTREGKRYVPPPCATPAFDDVPCGSVFAPWVNELAARGALTPCAPRPLLPRRVRVAGGGLRDGGRGLPARLTTRAESAGTV